MANVTVYDSGKTFTVQNAATLSRDMITVDYGGAATRTAKFLRLGYTVDDNQPTNSKGVLECIVRIENADGEFGDAGNGLNRAVTANFDETKANMANFANLLHRTAINALFLAYYGIEPLNVSDGSVVAPYDAP